MATDRVGDPSLSPGGQPADTVQTVDGMAGAIRGETQTAPPAGWVLPSGWQILTPPPGVSLLARPSPWSGKVPPLAAATVGPTDVSLADPGAWERLRSACRSAAVGAVPDAIVIDEVARDNEYWLVVAHDQVGPGGATTAQRYRLEPAAATGRGSPGAWLLCGWASAVDAEWAHLGAALQGIVASEVIVPGVRRPLDTDRPGPVDEDATPAAAPSTTCRWEVTPRQSDVLLAASDQAVPPEAARVALDDTGLVIDGRWRAGLRGPLCAWAGGRRCRSRSTDWWEPAWTRPGPVSALRASWPAGSRRLRANRSGPTSAPGQSGASWRRSSVLDRETAAASDTSSMPRRP